MPHLILHQPHRLNKLQKRGQPTRGSPASPIILLIHLSDSWNSIEKIPEEPGKTPRVGRRGDIQCEFHRNKRNRQKYGKCEPIDPENPSGGCTYCYKRGLPCHWRGTRKEQLARQRQAQERVAATSQWLPPAPHRVDFPTQGRRVNRPAIMGTNNPDEMNRLRLTLSLFRKTINCRSPPPPAGNPQRETGMPQRSPVNPTPQVLDGPELSPSLTDLRTCTSCLG